MDMIEIYNYLMIELSIPDTRDWLLVSSPFPLLLITLGYIYFVFYAGPRYMKNRPPYKLRTFVLIYNIIQILANLWSVREHISAGWFWRVGFICRPRSVTLLDKYKIYNMWWWLFILRTSDYVETCIFVLRKKQNQVSTLHVHHHISVLMFGWFYLKYVGDERTSFITLINCIVHVIMYTYYFFAAWSPELQRLISPIKPFITKLQMVQFIVIIIITLQFVNPDCDILHKGMPYIFIGNLLIFLILFYDFHKKTYTSQQKNN